MRSLTDEELLAEYMRLWWHWPAGHGRGDPVWEAWSAQFRAWCREHDTDPVESIRLKRAETLRQLRAECEAAGGTWEGENV